MILQRHARALTWFIGLLVILWAGNVYAQEPNGIDLTARVGLNGYCKEKNWIPIRVLVENTGAPVDGRVQVSYKNSDGGQSVYGQDISLPTTSRKELFLYFYLQGFVSNLKVSLTADGKTLASDDLKLSCLGEDTLLVGVWADDPSAFEMVNDMHPLTGTARTVALQMTDLPDRPEGWNALDALIISGVDTSQLTEAHQTALEVWIANGGRLLAVGGPKWEATAHGLKKWLPLEVTATQTVETLSALTASLREETLPQGEAIVAVGRVDADAHVILAQDGIPLILEKEFGFGNVIYLAVDPGVSPLRGWDAMTRVYTDVLASAPARLDWINAAWDTYTANNVVSAFGSSGVPSSVYICGWLVLYIVIVGPVNFLVLRRTKRRELAWLTIPATVIVFSVLAYAYGFVFRGQKPILNRIAVIQAWEESEAAQVRALVGVYSPRRARYTLETSDGFSLFPFFSDATALQNGDDWLTLNTESGAVVPDVRVEIGGMQSISAQGHMPALPVEQDLVVTVSDAMPTLKGQLTNTSPYTLKDAILFTSGGMMRLGDLASGIPQQVNISLSAPPNGPEFYNLDSWGVLDLNYYVEPDDVELSRRRMMMEMLVSSSNYYYNSNRGNWGVYLMGWIEEPILPVGLQGEAFEAFDTSLYVVRLTPSFAFEGKTWLLPPSLLAWESSLPGSTPYHSVEVQSGGYELRFHPVIPRNFSSIDQLVLNVNSPLVVNAQDISAFLWDFEDEQWVKVETLQWGANLISDPERYLGYSGEVRLKMTGDPNVYVEISASTMTLVVKP